MATTTTILHHPDEKIRFEISTSTRERDGEQYPVVRLGDNFVIFPTYEQLYALREALTDYVLNLATEKEETEDAIR